MTELILKVEDGVASSFKEISQQRFHGNDTLTLKSALQFLQMNADKEMSYLEQIVEQIQSEIDANGGITSKEIEACIEGYRHEQGSKGKTYASRH